MRAPIAEVVRDIRLLRPEQRTGYLQDLIGKPTSKATELDWRAHLISALSDAKVWPHGCPGAGDNVISTL